MRQSSLLPTTMAGRGIMHLHPEMLLQKARCLGNQVTCMIAEYHLTSSARGPSSLSPIIPEEAAALLPPKELCTRRCIRRHQGCEGCGPCQDPPGSCLATSAGHGRRRQMDGLRDFGSLAAPPRPSPGVIPDSEDEQPYLSRGCRLRPEQESACLRAITTLPQGTLCS